MPRLHLGLLLLLLALPACREPAPAPPTAPSAPAPAGPVGSAEVRWVEVRPAGATALLESPAQVRADPGAEALVVAPGPSRVLQVFARPGDEVAAGARLLSVRVPDLVTAAGELIAARTQLAAYQRRKQQLDELRKEGLSRLQEVSEVEVRMAEAEAAQQRALGVLKSAGLAAGDAPGLLRGQGALTLRSPIAGTVVEMNAVVGGRRDVGDPPLARIVGPVAGRVEARMARTPPADARFVFRAMGGPDCPVDPVATAPQVEASDGSRLAWFAPRCEPGPAPGTRGVLAVVFPPEAPAFVVPARAVGRVAGAASRFVVFRRAGERPEPVPVELLSISGTDALVRGPLAPGQSILAVAPTPAHPASDVD